ncbi:glutathione peroxidase [Sabulicella glaciei]|uniref:Glutathione peroxidase n=1 Tax=Sabulicella glaciei TaxID=2984948 RepID=A0ABT3NR85_9PROT|nr:glutathione peroxidase [Roseococcus sp. MDT2-1-1]MCW8084383.1 glutathione peroxidase [Roseococcus sp. MDT2-1-1]
MVDALRRAALLASSFVLPAVRHGHAATGEDAWGFSFEALEGGALPLAQYRGRVLLVVNTASFCGYTPQYETLQRLHERHEARGLTVIGVPSNDFSQESTEAAKVREFCDAMFGITFPLTAISHVRGERAHPFFRWAAAQAGPVRWNFHKYLVARDGRRVSGFSTQTAPDGPALSRALDAALAA